MPKSEYDLRTLVSHIKEQLIQEAWDVDLTDHNMGKEIWVKLPDGAVVVSVRYLLGGETVK